MSSSKYTEADLVAARFADSPDLGELVRCGSGDRPWIAVRTGLRFSDAEMVVAGCRVIHEAPRPDDPVVIDKIAQDRLDIAFPGLRLDDVDENVRAQYRDEAAAEIRFALTRKADPQRPAGSARPSWLGAGIVWASHRGLGLVEVLWTSDDGGAHWEHDGQVVDWRTLTDDKPAYPGSAHEVDPEKVPDAEVLAALNAYEPGHAAPSLTFWASEHIQDMRNALAAAARVREDRDR